ncbi:MAG: hypothetical protein RJQ09_05370 [Cyclobacteriaceae bacterium]
MDWIKLVENIKGFAKSYDLDIIESNSTFIGGQVTTYLLIENNSVYYEIKHSKPITEYGSKICIYSEVKGEITIKSKSRFFKEPSIKIIGEIPNNIQEHISELASIIGSFSWSIESDKYGWPLQLRVVERLKFECSLMNISVSQLDRIRLIHMEIVNHISNKSITNSTNKSF